MPMRARSIALRGICLCSALALLAAIPGCSFYYSSRSLSKSSKGISTSPSKSSKSGSKSSKSSSRSSKSSSRSSKVETTRYRDDVEELTEAWVASGGGVSRSDLLGAVGDIAARRGVTDWESDPSTWEGIGRGLGRAGLSEAQLEAYKYSWAGDDRGHMALIQRGYDATR
jgi:hypothetical protein